LLLLLLFFSSSFSCGLGSFHFPLAWLRDRSVLSCPCVDRSEADCLIS
jgi:hypothetical protein